MIPNYTDPEINLEVSRSLKNEEVAPERSIPLTNEPPKMVPSYCPLLSEEELQDAFYYVMNNPDVKLPLPNDTGLPFDTTEYNNPTKANGQIHTPAKSKNNEDRSSKSKGKKYIDPTYHLSNNPKNIAISQYSPQLEPVAVVNQIIKQDNTAYVSVQDDSEVDEDMENHLPISCLNRSKHTFAPPRSQTRNVTTPTVTPTTKASKCRVNKQHANFCISCFRSCPACTSSPKAKTTRVLGSIPSPTDLFGGCGIPN
eukprot:TRINITY_DN3317_c0_g1_i2.p1 TRINITY_DN3317_c0_g1~~TRINITY_DN3317_c0_g1_i2.p1  ORF type:complete len:255 (+),score=24.91 TRINITY_DN3317_c0_g1_i2:344-1108(+)